MKKTSLENLALPWPLTCFFSSPCWNFCFPFRATGFCICSGFSVHERTFVKVSCLINIQLKMVWKKNFTRKSGAPLYLDLFLFFDMLKLLLLLLCYWFLYLLQFSVHRALEEPCVLFCPVLWKPVAPTGMVKSELAEVNPPILTWAAQTSHRTTLVGSFRSKRDCRFRRSKSCLTWAAQTSYRTTLVSSFRSKRDVYFRRSRSCFLKQELLANCTVSSSFGTLGHQYES